MNILLTSGARRIDFVRFFQNAFKKTGTTGKVIVADPEQNAPSLQAGDLNYVIPPQTDEHYMEAVLDICKKHNVKALVPLNDLEVPKISHQKKQLEDLGVKVFAPDVEIVNDVRDKGKYRELLGSFGVRAPRSYLTIKTAEAALENGEVFFPLIIKPRNGSASTGIEIVHNLESLQHGYQQAVQVIKKSPLDDDTAKVAEENIIIQEVIDGEKFSLDLFNDLEGNPLAFFIRKQLEMRGGDVDRCITVQQGELTDIARKLGENLGHAGYMNVDVYDNGENYYVIDINPRFGGGYSFSHAAGADIPAVIVALAEGRKAKKEWLGHNEEMELARYDEVVHIKEISL